MPDFRARMPDGYASEFAGRLRRLAAIDRHHETRLCAIRSRVVTPLEIATTRRRRQTLAP